MPLLQLIVEMGTMLIIGLFVVTQVIFPLWFGKRVFWLFRRRSGKAHMEVMPPGRPGSSVPPNPTARASGPSYASKYSVGRGGSVAAHTVHEKRDR